MKALRLRRLAAVFSMLAVAAAATHAQAPEPASASAPVPEDSKRQLAAQIFETSKVAAMYTELLAQCSEASQTLATQAFAANPRAFGGLTPTSPHWPEVEVAYRRFWASSCNYMSTEELKEFFVERYASTIDEDDLRAAAAFYSSPAGQRFGVKAAESSSLLYPIASQRILAASEAASQTLRSDLQKVIDASRKNPNGVNNGP